MTPEVRYVLRLADTNLVLAQRLGEWVGHAPALEEDLGLANLSLDLLGQARLLLARAGELEGLGRGEDQLAYLREESEYFNLTLVEQPNGDFGDTVVRQFLFDAWQLGLYEALVASGDAALAAIAAKGAREAAYHLRYSGGWLVRLGDGTAESHARVAASLARLWPYTNELFHDDDVDRAAAAAGIGVLPSALAPPWSVRVDQTLAHATLARPAHSSFVWYGKQGRHSEHLGYLLAEMQSLHRAHPGASW
ncbi:MAG: phenylacetate-CoA oxygenase subunit PaaC [Gammaproteobacteria bacterium]|nr:phenylacetate-CoA oxygenase subunit PaaC [Gammaproteobacteria bacterium]